MAEKFEITLKQARLMRHALGLPNDKNKTFRNHYVIGQGCDDYSDWEKLVTAGYADVRRSHPLNPACDCFWATRKGAKAVLEDRETLCKEDFPEQD